MKKLDIYYARVSTIEQNEERQTQNKANFDYTIIDKCSGSIPLFERPAGKRINQWLNKDELESITVHSIDRLGRNTIDVLNVWKLLTEKGILVVCNNPGLKNLNPDGTPNEISNFIISIMSIMADYERKQIRQRQLEGIAIAKQKGIYVGRKQGSKEEREQFLNKEKPKKIAEYLSKEIYSWGDIQKLVNCSPSTISKVNRLINLQP